MHNLKCGTPEPTNSTDISIKSLYKIFAEPVRLLKLFRRDALEWLGAAPF